MYGIIEVLPDGTLCLIYRHPDQDHCLGLVSQSRNWENMFVTEVDDSLNTKRR